MKQQRRYKEPQDTLWGKFLSGFMAVVFAMSTLTLIPIASAINGEPNEAQVQQQEELADQTSGKDEKAAEPAADEQKLEPVELLSIASVEDEDDADDATPADVTLKVKAQNATVTYNGKDAATELVVPADKDVKFTVKAADGFTLGAAAVKLADAKGETTLTPNAGEYTVAADRVADGATIVVAAEAATGSANTDAAEPSTPAPSTELGEKMEMAKSVITSVFESVFGGTSTLAITGEDKVAVGKTIQLSGSSNGKPSCKYQTWTSDDGNVATVNSSGKVTGIKAGKVTITHTYCNAGWLELCHHDGNGNSTIKSETFEITVTDPGAETGSWVYVYTQVTGDTTGLVVNEDGWFTLGKVFIPSLRAATVSEDTNKTIASEEMEQTVINAVKSDKFIRYSKNQGISIDDVNFKRQNNTYGNHGLHKAQQAADYDEAPYYAWHLDGTVEVRNLGSVVYRCVDDLGNQLEANIPAETFSVGTDVNRSTADAPAISGYTCKAVAQSKDERVPTEGDSNVSFSVEHATHYVTYIYEKNTYALTTQADQNSTIDQGQTYEYSADGTIDVAFSANTGYTVTSVKVDGAELDEAALAAAVAAGKVTVGKTADHSVEVATTINEYAYTVEYYYDDTLGETDAASAVFNSVVTSDPATSTTHNDVNYTLVNVTPADGITISVDETANVIRVYYEKDTITDPNNDGNGDENPGDGIPDKYQAVVNYVSANDAQGTVNLAQKVVTFANNAISGTVNIFDGVTPNPTAGFVFDGWTEGGNAVVSNLTRELQGNTEYTFTANWALDVIGTDPTDPGNNAPDGIADKYQLVVTYAAIAGTIDGPARYVLNKYDAAGNLAEDGVAVLTAAQIPGTTADDGYGNGVWNNEPLANMELTDDTAFVIAFTALPAAAVVVPPLAPVAAAAPAAAAAAAATILDDGVPLATIDDDENALAAFEEIHCWTHWLMIFGALVTIVYGLAVLYRRRHGIRDMDDFEGDIMGGRKYDAAAEKSPAAGNAFQAM